MSQNDGHGSSRKAHRRDILKAVTAVGTVGLAGCSEDSGTTPTGTRTTGDSGIPTGTPTPTETPMQPPEATETPIDVVTPPRDPPSDATVLFGDGVEGLDRWQAVGGGDPPWIVEDDSFTIDPGTGWIKTADPIGDCHLHIEFTVPDEQAGDTNANSGVFMMGRYEFQVLDNWILDGRGDKVAGTYYGQSVPLVDPARPSTEWQAFDIIWRGPRFRDGNVAVPARATMLFNGVVVQPHINVAGQTTAAGPDGYAPHPRELPFQLQDHTKPVQFRNVWYRSLPEEREPDVPELSYDTTDPETGYPYQQAGYPIRHPDVVETVEPGDKLGDPPSDATVLLSGDNLNGWVGPDGGSPGWREEEGYVAVEPGAGNIRSEDSFGDSQVHVEFRIPEDGDDGQGESGVLLSNRHAIKIRDNDDGDVDPTRRVGAYTGQAAPLSDPARPRGEWQAFDVVWEGPRFGDGGKLFERYARMTVLLNGVVVQNRLYLSGPNANGEDSSYRAHDPEQPIGLAENGDPVHFRNVWYRSFDA